MNKFEFQVLYLLLVSVIYLLCLNVVAFGFVLMTTSSFFPRSARRPHARGAAGAGEHPATQARAAGGHSGTRAYSQVKMAFGL